MRKPPQFENWPDSLQPGYGPYRVATGTVVDGDTVYGLGDLGMNEYSFASFRLHGVDAPEVYSGPEHVRVWGRATMAQLERIVPPDTKTLAHTYKDRQTFGRYEATFVLADGTTANDRINAWMREQEWYEEYRAYKEAA